MIIKLVRNTMAINIAINKYKFLEYKFMLLYTLFNCTFFNNK